MSVQPDLFGEYDQAQQDDADRHAARIAWEAWLRAEPAPLPYDCLMGDKGTVVTDWWRCPGCGRVELGTYALGLNHGFYPDQPGVFPWQWDVRKGCNSLSARKADQPA